MKKSIIGRVLPLLLLTLTAGFTACNSEDVSFDTASLVLTPNNLVFNADGTPEAGAEFTVDANRSWMITGDGEVSDWETAQKNKPADYGWIGLDRVEGDGRAKVRLTILPNSGEDRSVRIMVVSSIKKEFVTITQKGNISTDELYRITFGQGAPSSSPYPYLDQWTESLGVSGTGSSTASVEGSGVSLRQSGSISTGYNGASGNNKLFFSSNANFTVKTISTSGADRFKITFGVSHYDNGTKENDFTYDKLSVEVSADGSAYIPVNYTASPEPTKGLDAWYYCTGYADLANTGNLYVRIVANVASAISLDDVVVYAITGGTPGGPQVTTAAATNITATGATVGGSYSPADAAPSQVGVEYRTGSNPYAREAATTVQTPFTVALNGLTDGTLYTYRAYAIIGGTTLYGTEMTFTAGNGGGPGPGPGGEFFTETFGTGDKTASPWPKVGEYTFYDNGAPVVFSDEFGTADLRKLKSGDNLTDHLWLPANKDASLKIAGINADGKTDIKLTFDLAANLYAAGDQLDQNVVKINFDGTDFTLPSKMLSNAGGDNNKFYTLTVDLTGMTGTASSTLTFKTLTAENTLGVRLDNIKLSGDGSGGGNTFSFGQAAFSGTLVKDAAISGAKVTVPYYNATAQSYSSVNVAVGGPAAAGISVTQQSSITLGNGNGSIDFIVTGTPTTAGEVTFTITGLTELTNPKNVATATVTAGAGPGAVVITGDFSQAIAGMPSSKPAANSPEYTVSIDGYNWTMYGCYNGAFGGSNFLMIPGKDYTPKGYIILPLVSGKAIKSVVFTSGPSSSKNVDISLQVETAPNVWADVETQKMTEVSTDFTYNVSSPQVNTRYRLTIADASNYNGQASKIVVTAE